MKARTPGNQTEQAVSLTRTGILEQPDQITSDHIRSDERCTEVEKDEMRER